MTTSSRPEFPNGGVLAQAFFEEGIRHLQDARILHQGNRHPAAIASAMKAAELGVKAMIILNGAMGWWDKIFLTHSPLGDINNLAVFRHYVVALTDYKRTLVADVIDMERLAPARPGGAYDINEQKNPEYPFLSYHPNPSAESGTFRLGKPSTHFVEADSKKYYNTAQDLLTAVATRYIIIGSWGLAIPDPI